MPWRLLDRFLASDHELPNLRRFFERAESFTTRSTDQGELSPWITWPSFHRGMPNTEHAIQFLGQDPASFKGTPIWEEYRRAGHSIGICGSLQSWPPVDPGAGGFYVPDTFARDERCIPSWVEPFQKFNLKQVGMSGRVIDSGSVYGLDSLKLALSLPRLGIRPTTALRVIDQLVRERLDSTRIARRPVFQAVLLWEVFRKLFNPARPPAFSTFFTNHVAGIMHRYWDHVFPEDFSHEAGPRPHFETMLFAVEWLDRLLGEAMGFCERNPDLMLVFAASMGQGPKVWKRQAGYTLTVPKVERLLGACGVGASEHESLLAMVPQVCARIPDGGLRAQAVARLDSARTLSGDRLFELDQNGDRLSITLITPMRVEDIVSGRLMLAGASVTFESVGIQVQKVEAGTGYHIPEGAMAIYGRGVTPSSLRKPLLAAEAKNLLLGLAGLSSARADASGSA